MTDRSTVTRRHPGRGRAWVLAVACAALLFGGTPQRAWAILYAVGPSPGHPTTCDSVALYVSGAMPDPCYHLIGAEIEGPTELPTMGPIPTYQIRLRITVQEPNPLIDAVCPTVLDPYKRGFGLGRLPFGRYFVSATEYLVPFTQDSTAAPKDSSQLASSFDVAPGACPPGIGCYILSFGRDDPSQPPKPGDGCDASVAPGESACVDVTLMNDKPVGGVQTEIVIYDPRSNAPAPADRFRTSSVEPTGRAAGFRVVWSAEGSRTKILLFSAGGARIEPGQGPVLRVCYSVAAGVHEGRYPIRHGNEIVADPDGAALTPCPTFAEIVGHLCVTIPKPVCDLNGDGISNIRDIIVLAHCALRSLGVSGVCPDSIVTKADCNGDGTVDIRDVICCVRRILDGGGFGSGGGTGVPGAPDLTTFIKFVGRPAWVDRSTGRATIEIDPAADFGGVQFAVNATGGARVRDLALIDFPSGVSLETGTAGNSGLGMLYRTDPTTAPGTTLAPGAIIPRRPIFAQVTFDLLTGTDGAARLTLGGISAATSAGGAAPTAIESGTVAVPANPATAPTVSAPAPNPFASGTAINYALSISTRVTIRVYDVNGRLVRSLIEATMPAGNHSALWDGRDTDGRDLSSGIYFFKFQAGDVEKTDRLLKLR